ncbi:MAG: hypothetical protein Greene041619_979 [Candidatus Peregrinibacteria bacterium Greene0416_19]|nr:MAG: hypothetical protein Greene041619_979 [Candidatus Peregrinibacteria bacterium Greene0416_19]
MSLSIKQLVKKLNGLFQLGLQKEIWKYKNDCASACSIPEEHFQRHLRGQGGVANIKSSVTKLDEALRALDVDPEAAVHTTSPPGEDATFRDWFFYGMTFEPKLWKDAKTCAAKVGLSQGTIQKYLRPDAHEALNTPKSQTMYAKALDKIQAVVGRQDAKRAKHGSERPARGHRAQTAAVPVEPQANLRPAVPEAATEAAVPVGSQPALTDIVSALMTFVDALGQQCKDFFDDRFMDRLADRVVQKLSQSSGPAASIPAGIVPSNWIDEVIAGRMELLGPTMPNLRFVLTALVFQKLTTEHTGEERKDTIALGKIIVDALREYRRRLVNSAHMEDTDGARSPDVKAFASTNRAIVAQAKALEADVLSYRRADLTQRQVEYLERYLELERTFAENLEGQTNE